MSHARFGFFVAVVVLAALASGVRADEDAHEQDEARRAAQGGVIRPLSEILAKLPPAVAAEIVRVKLKQRDGTWIYEFRLVDSRGRRSEIHVDAATGAEIGEEHN